MGATTHILGMGCGAKDSGKEMGKEPEPRGEALAAVVELNPRDSGEPAGACGSA